MKLISRLILLLILPALVFAAKPEITEGMMGSMPVKRWQTEQGMSVLFAQTRELPIVDIRLVFDAGAARDEKEKAGTALLTNSLLLEGSEELDANEIAISFEDLGVQYGNGSYRDMAVLDFRSLSDKNILSGALVTIEKMLRKPLFAKKDLNREKNTLKVSIAMDQQNPSSVAGLAFYENLYGSQNHPYANPVKGTLETLKNISSKDIENFFHRYYVSGNAVLTLVGDLSDQQAIEISGRLSKLLNPGVHADTLMPAKEELKDKNVNIDFDSEQTTIIMGKVSIKRGDPDYYTLYVANHIFGGSGFSSRLTKDIRVKHGLTYGVSSGFRQMREKGPFVISLTTKNSSAAKAVELIKENLKNFSENGPTEEELHRAKLNITGSMPLDTASNKQFSEHLAVVGFYDLPIDYLDQFKQGVENVSIEDIKQVFSRRISIDSLATIIVGKIQ